MRSLSLAAGLFALCAAGAPSVLAQQSQPPSLRAPPPSPECQRGATSPATPGETTGSANLSDELSRSKGIICPPAGIDPGISAPPLGGGVMPVIPPPGTPGGDPGIIPK
jgi:hypothetical protein